MAECYNLYCDESCHLQNDHQSVMLLGTIWCPKEETRKAFIRIREIKQKHNLAADFEIKWTKVSKSKQVFYLDLVDYFFDTSFLNFRVVVSKKDGLNHQQHAQTHEHWYYKQYYLLIHHLLTREDQYNVYLDIKDTRGAEKRDHLREVLSRGMHDSEKKIIHKIQAVRSEEVELLQLTDLLIGAVGYANRSLTTNTGKTAVINRIKKRSGHPLTRTTFFREMKFNVFIWEPTDSNIC